jgi:hypothetical protein
MQEVIVAFHGEGRGTGELTWGQREIWQTMRRTGHTMNIGGAMELSAGTTVAEIVRVLKFLVSRHQALRTRLHLRPEEEWPSQEVFASGEIVLSIVDTEDDAAAAAEVLRSRFELTPFDYEHEWPVRMAVIRRAGVLTHLVVQYCHLAVDGGGVDALVRDLSRMDSAGPVEAITPLELAAFQQLPAGCRQSAKSLRFWENALGGVPRNGFSGDPREPRYWEICCYSPAMHLALRSIAARTGSDTAHVLLAAYAVALARVTGVSPSVAQIVVSNRFRPRFRDAAAQLSQPGLCVVDVADCTFDDVVGRAWNALTSGSLHGYYDPSARRDLLRRLSADRGQEADISCFVNDRRTSTDGALPTEADLAEALKRTVLRWDRKQETFTGRFFLQVDSGPDANVPGRVNAAESPLPAVYFAIWADTHFLAPDDIEACARELEAVTVAAAFDGTVPTGITRAQ